MRGLIFALVAISTMLECSCGQPANSSVGAKRLRTASELAKETIQINRFGGPPGYEMLSYELRPDDSLAVTRTVSEPPPTRVEGPEFFRLSSNVARAVRTDLRIVRPDDLRGIEYLILPVGCQRVVDATSEATVVFMDSQKRLGIADLPTEANCKTVAGSKARAAVESALGRLPASNVASHFAGRR